LLTGVNIAAPAFATLWARREVRMKRVGGKVCVVTGGALGIGRACALRLADEGADVAIFDVLKNDGAALSRHLQEKGVRSTFHYVDVSNERNVAEALAQVDERLGSVDVLVNNAGIAGVNKPTHELTEQEWDHVQAVNVKGVFFCTKHAIPIMLRTGGGSIINLSSIYGLVGAADVPAYHASKGAVRLMTKTDALLYAKNGIRVNSVHPGFIWTPMVENHLHDSGVLDLEQGRRDLAALHPLGHVGEPDDIAWAVVYLASNESKFVTGTELVVDGGYTAH
jgi:NAD(P)-dependent dehydrogenase (short-subunit alcohol dehydrogenase family)